jgi:integrase
MTLTLRSEIINQYRARIQKHTRLRLSKDELEALIDGFVGKLREAKTEKQIKALCEAEIKLLEEGYPKPSVAKYVTRYRKAITTAIEDGSLPLTKTNSHRYIHQQRVTGVQEERLEHWALTYLKYSPAVYESIDKRSQETNREKQLNLRLVPVERYLEMLRGFLEKKGRFEARWLATAIAGLTGRRFAEVVSKGTFSLTDHPYLLRFEGQLKSRAGHGDGYDIVTLFPAAEVLEAIERLRKLPEVKAIAKLKGAALSTALNAFNQKLNSVTGKVLIQVVPPLEGKKGVSVHNLRSLYGAIAVHFFCPELQHEYAFVQHFLGHVMDSPATGHYFRYALSDDQDALLRTKGVMLGKVQKLPLGRAEKEPLIELDDEPLALELEPQPAVAAVEAEVKPIQGTQQNRAIEATVEPQAVPDAWRSELERRLEEMRAEFEAQIQKLRQESNVGWFVRRVEGLERENLALRLERDRAIAAVQKTDDAEVVQLKKEKEAIALELKLAQDKLNSFRQLLNGGDAEETAADADAGDAIVQQETADVVAVVEQGAAAGEREEAGAIVPQNAWTGRARAETETGAKRGPKGGKAFKRAEAIFLAVKDWNRQNPFETFAFNAGILETVFKVHRQAAKDFFEAYQNELWEYHQEIGVESPKRHNWGKDTERLRAFVEGRLKGVK